MSRPASHAPPRLSFPQQRLRPARRVLAGHSPDRRRGEGGSRDGALRCCRSYHHRHLLESRRQARQSGHAGHRAAGGDPRRGQHAVHEREAGRMDLPPHRVLRRDGHHLPDRVRVSRGQVLPQRARGGVCDLSVCAGTGQLAELVRYAAVCFGRSQCVHTGTADVRNGGCGAAGGRVVLPGASVCEALWKETLELTLLVCWKDVVVESRASILQFEIDIFLSFGILVETGNSGFSTVHIYSFPIDMVSDFSLIPLLSSCSSVWCLLLLVVPAELYLLLNRFLF